MRYYIPKVGLAVAGLMLSICVVCAGAGDPFKNPPPLEPFGVIAPSLFSSDFFKYNPIEYFYRDFETAKYNFASDFLETLNISTRTKQKIVQQCLFTLDRERDDYLFRIGAQNRPLDEQLEFVKRQLKKKQEQESQGAVVNEWEIPGSE